MPYSDDVLAIQLSEARAQIAKQRKDIALLESNQRRSDELLAIARARIAELEAEVLEALDA